MLRLIIAIVFASGLLINQSSNTLFAENDDIKIVLIGVVVEQQSQKPINFAMVELSDPIYDTKQTFETKEDGTFHFKLESGKQYALNLLDVEGNVISTKDISTVNKNDPEILRTILETQDAEIKGSGVSDDIPSGQ